MKKILLVFALLFSVSSVTFAQDNPSPEQMMQRMKEKIKPELMAKAGLTEEQADKVIEINFQAQRQRRQVRMDQQISAEEKTKRYAEIDAARDKEYSGIPLTADQIKAANLYFSESVTKQKLAQ